MLCAPRTQSQSIYYLLFNIQLNVPFDFKRESTTERNEYRFFTFFRFHEVDALGCGNPIRCNEMQRRLKEVIEYIIIYEWR